MPLKNISRINGTVHLKCEGNIRIGTGLRINSGKNVNVIGGDVRTNIIIGKKARFSLGNNVGISNSTFICSNSINIEDNVLIGGNCKIYDTDFHSLDISERIDSFIKRIKGEGVKTAPIHIMTGVWIGVNCIVLKGVTIGNNAIIGAGSIITKDIPPDEIWAGNPAQFIRKNKKYNL